MGAGGAARGARRVGQTAAAAAGGPNESPARGGAAQGAPGRLRRGQRGPARGTRHRPRPRRWPRPQASPPAAGAAPSPRSEPPLRAPVRPSSPQLATARPLPSSLPPSRGTDSRDCSTGLFLQTSRGKREELAPGPAAEAEQGTRRGQRRVPRREEEVWCAARAR